MLYTGWDDAYQGHNTESLWQDAPIPIIDDTITVLKAQDAKNVCDIGCGDGRNLLPLALAGLHCAGNDLSAKALGHAAHRLAQHGLRAFLLPGDATRLPFADNSLDAITCFDVFGQFEAPELALAEFRRVLVPGGLLALNAFTLEDDAFGVGEPVGSHRFLYKNTLFKFFEEAEIQELLSEYEIIRIERVAWQDPPHGDFRPYPHRHESWVVFATPRS